MIKTMGQFCMAEASQESDRDVNAGEEAAKGTERQPQKQPLFSKCPGRNTVVSPLSTPLTLIIQSFIAKSDCLQPLGPLTRSASSFRALRDITRASSCLSGSAIQHASPCLHTDMWVRARVNYLNNVLSYYDFILVFPITLDLGINGKDHISYSWIVP